MSACVCVSEGSVLRPVQYTIFFYFLQWGFRKKHKRNPPGFVFVGKRKRLQTRDRCGIMMTRKTCGLGGISAAAKKEIGMHSETMKCVNIMNFVRQCEPRDAEVDALLFETTKRQLEQLQTLRLPHTFLLQYDALCDERFVSLFKEQAGADTETGLWYEIVEPLTAACGMPYESAAGWKWDWHIRPGFPMAYLPQERDRLIDEAMRKYKEVFGSYPTVVGSWLIDTRTACRLADKYGVQCLCICRDQTNTDAYSLVGGYFNGAYYPSRKNIFTPAQTAGQALPVPVFRLLGPSPIHNYDGKKFIAPDTADQNVIFWTLEPVWFAGASAAFESVMLDYFFGDEVLNFAYAQIGQENSFGASDILSPLRRQIETLQRRGDVRFEKMSETAKHFCQHFPDGTPPTVTVGLKNWDKEDLQSVYYQCKNYVVNLFRDGKRVFIRALYLFDENVPEHYLNETCDSFYALYENLPLVDTVVWAEDIRENIGLTLDKNGGVFSFETLSDTAVKVSWDDKAAVFTPSGIETSGICEMTFAMMNYEAQVRAEGKTVSYLYKGARYALETNGSISLDNGVLTIRGTQLSLTPRREKQEPQCDVR